MMLPDAPKPELPQHDPLDFAVRNVELAIADFYVEVMKATTSDRLHQIHDVLTPLILCLESAQSAALDHNERLCGAIS